MLNIHVCTDGHVDEFDDLVCVVIPFGVWHGGELVLHEAGLVVEMKSGDIIIFPSSKITHFNLHFTGTRLSIVMHSDKYSDSWVKDRNGWKAHMATY